jgi:hypothetical protein
LFCHFPRKAPQDGIDLRRIENPFLLGLASLLHWSRLRQDGLNLKNLS